MLVKTAKNQTLLFLISNIFKEVIATQNFIKNAQIN
jgi:hypothetical protein